MAQGSSPRLSETGRSRRCKYSLDEKIGDLNRPDERGVQPLTRALTPPLTTHGNLIAIALIAAKADLNKGTPPPLLCAVELYSDSFRMKIVELMLNAAQPSGRDTAGNTALHVASRSRDTRVMKLLIEAQADVTATDNAGRTALHAALDGNLDSSDSDDSETEKHGLRVQKLTCPSLSTHVKSYYRLFVCC